MTDPAVMRLSRGQPPSRQILSPLEGALAGASAGAAATPLGSTSSTGSIPQANLSRNRVSSSQLPPISPSLVPPPPPSLSRGSPSSTQLPRPGQLTPLPPLHAPGDFHFDGQPALEDFELLTTLGTGTFGKVRLCRHKMSGKFFAMKILKKATVCRLKQAQHIMNERRILLEHANHPRIVRLYTTFQDEECLYMVQEYVAGGEIFSHLRKKGSFNIDTARYYAAQIVLVLEHLHSRNVVYRDLKPENLLLDAQGQLKITDFGFAKFVPDVTFTLCGTPEYLAPEIILNTGHNKGVDWWALGILIYEMLLGFPPFFDDNPFKTYEQIVQKKPPFPANMDPAAKSLIQKLLEKNKTKRLGCMHQGALEVKQHPFFRNVNWEAMLMGTVRAPITPVVRTESDTHNFENYPEDEPEPEVPDDGLPLGADGSPDSDPNCFADF